jgi:hypothetical protein
VSSIASRHFRIRLIDLVAGVAIVAVFCASLVSLRNSWTAIVYVSFVSLFPVYGLVCIALRCCNLLPRGWLSGLFWVILVLTLYHDVSRSMTGGYVRYHALAIASTGALFGSFFLFEIYVYLALRKALTNRGALKPSDD